MSLSDLPLDRPIATIAFLISLMVLGAVGLLFIPLDFFPPVQEPEIDIEVPFPGAHPLEALNEVVRPIEAEIATIPDVRRMFSNVRADEVDIEVQFDWSVDIDLKRMEVRDAVDRARDLLPDLVGHIRVEGDVAGPAGGAVLAGRISARRNLSESWDLLDRRIKRPLERVRGVARVDLYGVEPQQVRIDLDLDALRAHDISPEALIRSLDAANVDMDLGAIRGDVLRYDIRAVGRFRDLDTIRELKIPDSGVRVRDVARVALEEPVLDYGRHLDRSFAIGIDVYKEASANTVETVDRLKARIREIENDPELQGIQLLIWDDSAEGIRMALGGLRNAGMFGGALALIVLFLFLRRWRTTLIVGVAIPFSLLVTCGAMYMLDIPLNVLSMLGLMLGVGMLVDNAVVVMENIHRLEGLGMAPREAARKGVRQMTLPVIAATATTMIVWSWVLISEKRDMTIYIGIFAGVICLAVACSLIISLTFIPLAAARFVPHRELRPGFLLSRIVPRYRRLVGWTIGHWWSRVLTLAALAALAASMIIPFGMIDKSGDTREQETDVPIIYRIYDTHTKEELEAYVDQVEAWIESRKDELGYDSLYSWFSEPQEAQTRVFLDRERAHEGEIARLRKALQEGLPVIPGVKLEVGEREWWRHSSQGRRMVMVALHGDDPEYLHELSERVETRLREIPEAVEVYGPSLQGRKEVRIVVDPDRARALNVTVRHVADSVAFAFRGQQLRRFDGATGEIELRVGLPEDDKPGLAAAASLPIPRDGMEVIPLSSVAEIQLARTMPGINRVDRQTTSHISVQFDEEKHTTDQAMKIVSDRMDRIPLPEGYSWDHGRWGRDHDEALGVMGRGVAMSLLLVILLMAALFESLTQPLAIVVTLPLAFFGTFWSLWLGGFDLDVIAFLGVILLIGLVVNNGIVMVDHVNRLRREGRNRAEALVQGCGDRLRPVLMTAITTFFGLLPLGFSSFTVAGVYIDSMAVAIIGGLASSTIFTLIALPVWYTTVEDLGLFLRRLLPRAGRPRRVPRPAAPMSGDAPGATLPGRPR